MAVKFRVVGIFLQASITMKEAAPQYRVQDVMDRVMELAGNGLSISNGSGGTSAVTNFWYEAPGPYVTTIGATYASEFKTSELGTLYPAASYSLTETFQPDITAPDYTNWQYYVLNADGQPVSYKDQSFTGQTVVVPDGGTLIWRCVSILNNPNVAMHPKAMKMLAAMK
jgi:hypothetical protein